MLRLLAIFTIGVPQTESAIPMAHWLPLVLSSLLCLGGSLLYASDWSTDYPLNSLSFLALFLLQFVFLWQGSRYFRKREMSTLCQVSPHVLSSFFSISKRSNLHPLT